MRFAHRSTISLAAAGALVLGVVPFAHSAPEATTIVINEVYGGGESSDATYRDDFVELFNPTSQPVELAGWKIGYASAKSGNFNSACTLAGTIPARGFFLVQTTSSTTTSPELPAPDVKCSAKISLSATDGAVKLTNAAGDQVDLVGYGTSPVYLGSGAAPRLSKIESAGRVSFTGDNKADFTKAAPTPQNSAADPLPFDNSSPSDTASPAPSATDTPSANTITPISAIQGTGDKTPLDQQTVTTLGIVTAAYPTGNFNGVYLQTPGSGGVEKKPGDASDGIFYYSQVAAAGLKIGDCVEVTAKAGEYYGLTQLSGGSFQSSQGCEPVKATVLETLPATDADKEPYEGMLVLPKGTYTITNNYQLNQYGQLGLAFGDQPLFVATDVVRPGKTAEDYEAENLKKYITLDDGSSWDYMKNDTAKKSPLPYLSQTTPMRTNSHLTFEKPVILDYRFQWNFQPTSQVVGPDAPFLTSENDRPAKPADVGGDVKLATFNVLNYFTDLGKDEPGCKYYSDMNGDPVATNYCTVRGAYSESAFKDQQEKIVAAINGLGADVVGLEEVQNSAQIPSKPGQNRDKALAALVKALNDAGGRWDYVPSPIVVPGSEDVIRTAFIYNPTTVELVGPSRILIDDAFANARQPLAQEFKAKGTTTSFVAITNHFKSKGSGDDDGTGQGKSNPSRVAQAKALSNWANTLPEFKDKAIFLIGDFNAYSKEDPVAEIEKAGFTNLVAAGNADLTTYQFGGRLGSLDHEFANAKAHELVTGATVWNINADESIAMQYSRRRYNVTDFHQATPFASSDHDPAIVGIKTQKKATTPDPTPTPDPSPTPDPTPNPVQRSPWARGTADIWALTKDGAWYYNGAKGGNFTFLKGAKTNVTMVKQYDWFGGQKADLFERTSNGDLTMRVDGTEPPVTIGRRWNGINELVFLGGRGTGEEPLLIGRHVNGNLYGYRFAKGRLDGMGVVGYRWGSMNSIFSVGNTIGDSKSDVLAINGRNNTLYGYAGRGGAKVSEAVRLGGGWGGFRAFTPGRIDADRRNDLASLRDDGTLFMYSNNGSGFSKARQFGGGFDASEVRLIG